MVALLSLTLAVICQRVDARRMQGQASVGLETKIKAGTVPVIRAGQRLVSRVGPFYMRPNAYAFDWDDNILHMPTRVHMERKGVPVVLTTSEFAAVRHDKEFRPPGGNVDSAFREFDDHPDADYFYEHAGNATAAGNVGPAFATFLRAVINGDMWSIITARRHSADNFRRGAKRVIELSVQGKDRETMLHNIRSKYGLAEASDNDALDLYLHMACRFYGVNSKEFVKTLKFWTENNLAGIGLNAVNPEGGLDPRRPEDGKKIALLDFTQNVLSMTRGAPVTVGFSDDDGATMNALDGFVDNVLAPEFTEVGFELVSTSSGHQEVMASFKNGARVAPK